MNRDASFYSNGREPTTPIDRGCQLACHRDRFYLD